MDDLMQTMLRQNNWATLQIIDLCEGLTEEQLEQTQTGVYGSIRETLIHIVNAQDRYVFRLTGEEAASEPGFPGFDVLRKRVEASGERLVELAGSPPQEEIRISFGGSDYTLSPSVILVQAVNHATEHRSQILTLATPHVDEVPMLDGWSYASDAGLMERID